MCKPFLIELGRNRILAKTHNTFDVFIARKNVLSFPAP